MTAFPFGRIDVTRPALPSGQPEGASGDGHGPSSEQRAAQDTISPSRLAFFASPLKLTQEPRVARSSGTADAEEPGTDG